MSCILVCWGLLVASYCCFCDGGGGESQLLVRLTWTVLSYRTGLELDHWKSAFATGLEVHCHGDMNLNHCNWTDPNLPHSNQSYKLRELTLALFARIIPLGVAQLVSGPTRHFPGQKSIGLDHYYTNRPDKTSPVQKHHNGGSDPLLIGAIRFSRSIQKRSFKNFDSELFIQEVRKISWLDVCLCEDADKAVHLQSSSSIGESCFLRTRTSVGPKTSL